MTTRRTLGDVLVWDVGLAVVVYFGSRALGFGEYVSLLNATVVALLRVGYLAVRRQPVSLVVGDAALALALLLACLLCRPAAFLVAVGFIFGWSGWYGKRRERDPETRLGLTAGTAS